MERDSRNREMMGVNYLKAAVYCEMTQSLSVQEHCSALNRLVQVKWYKSPSVHLYWYKGHYLRAQTHNLSQGKVGVGLYCVSAALW